MRTLSPFLLAAASAALVGCSRAEPRAAADGATPTDSPVIEVRALDFAFEAPDTVPAGLVTFRMRAEGRAFHHAEIVRLDSGHTLAEYAAAVAASGGAPPAWAHWVGGVNGADPGGGVAETAVPLTPGTYGLICMIPGPDGRSHLAMGMMRPFVVTGSAEPIALPAADLQVTMLGPDFTLSNLVTSDIRTILVTNVNGFPREALLLRLADGRTADDLVRWVRDGMQGPPPASGVAGTAPLHRNRWNVLHVTLTPGRYVFADFLPNAADGRPNVLHGMVREVEVR